MNRRRRQSPFFLTRWVGALRRGGLRLPRLRVPFLRRRNRWTASRSSTEVGDPSTPPPAPRGRAFRLIAPILAAVVAFALPVFGVQAYRYVMKTGHFFVKDVVVDGHERLTLEEVREIAGIQPNTHLLSADLKGIVKRLRASPWIAQATLRRELPDLLHIEVVEHRPVAYLAVEQLMFVNPAGEPFATVGDRFELSLPIITGHALAAFADPDRAVSARARVQSATNFVRGYAKLGFDVRWPIAEIHVDSNHAIALVLSGTGTEVRLGKGPFREKLYRLEWTLESLRQRGKVADYVLLDVADESEDAGRVIVKAKLALSDRARAKAAAAHRQPALPTPGAKVTSKRATSKPKARRGLRKRPLKKKRGKRRSHRMLPQMTRKTKKKTTGSRR